MRIVVVDDDEEVLLILRAMFQRQGHEVLAYGNPLDCPIFTSVACPCSPVAVCPDIIISDIDMPKVDGVEFVTRVIDKACRCRKVAFLSGHMLSDDLLALLAKTKVKFFQKPLDIVSFNEWLM